MSDQTYLECMKKAMTDIFSADEAMDAESNQVETPPLRISELIAVLKRRQEKYGNSLVMITWEGTDHLIRATNVYQRTDKILALDGDENFYKTSTSYREAVAIDPNEGDDGL